MLRRVLSLLAANARIVSLAALAGVAACDGGTTALTPPPNQQQMSVPLSFFDSTVPFDPTPHILVAMPSASPVSMLLDTGSTGLRVFPSALAAVPSSSYVNTGKPEAQVFDDRVFYGTVGVAAAGVVIGGRLRVAKPLDFQIVTAVCAGVPSPVPNRAPADCRNITVSQEANSDGGYIGVRPQIGDGVLFSPFAELPEPYSDGFTVSAYGSAPRVTFGTTARNQTGFELYRVGAATAPDGSPLWTGNDLLPWCYAITVPGSGTVDGCPSTGVLIDSGGINERLSLPVAPSRALAPNTVETLPPGSTIVATLAAPDAVIPAIVWTVTTGTCQYYDVPFLYFEDPSATPTPPPSGTPKSNDGIAPFLTNDVLFDLRGGTLGFRPVNVPPPAFCL